MSKLTKNERIDRLERQVAALTTLLKMKGCKEPEPKLKVLDQSVFDGLDAKWRFAAIDFDSEVRAFEQRPVLATNGMMWDSVAGEEISLGKGVRVIKWYNSLIERDKVELTGSDLARAMLERGDKHVMCFIGDTSEPATIARGLARIVIGIRKDRFETDNTAWKVAIPINSQGEPLTQSEAGL